MNYPTILIWFSFEIDIEKFYFKNFENLFLMLFLGKIYSIETKSW
jgi:hypothetical protein